jgi:mannose-6-phosphate isomerase-like protein (cupin superfamily)
MQSPDSIFETIEKMLGKKGFTIAGKDDARPWGGFFVIDEKQAADFAQEFFPEEDIDKLKLTQKLSPKILLVAPGRRLSWQYHFRRAEIWCCINGPVAVATSHTDEESEKHILQAGDIIRLPKGERHRLIGLHDWGIVAEIWQHTDADYPSDENDIVRLQDDFGR